MESSNLLKFKFERETCGIWDLRSLKWSSTELTLDCNASSFLYREDLVCRTSFPLLLGLCRLDGVYLCSNTEVSCRGSLFCIFRNFHGLLRLHVYSIRELAFLVWKGRELLGGLTFESDLFWLFEGDSLGLFCLLSTGTWLWKFDNFELPPMLLRLL